MEQLARRIHSGEWTPGERLPSEWVLAEEYSVAYMTVRSAVSSLVESGHLRRIRGRGTFVVPSEERGVAPSLGLLLPANWHSLDPFYFPRIVTGFSSAAEQLGYQVRLADRTEPLMEYIQLRELKVGAVACVMIDRSDIADADALLDRGVEVVAINHYRGSRRITSVSPANRQGMRAVVSHLLDLGHRHIAFLAGPATNLDAEERRRGAVAAVADHGLPTDCLTVIPGFFPEASGYERTKQLLADLPTAVVAASDLAAIGAMRALQEAGVRVPQDVSVVGFGDFRPASFLFPSLTTVQLQLEEVGAQAAHLLVQQSLGHKYVPKVIESPVIIRESSAAPRSLN